MSYKTLYIAAAVVFGLFIVVAILSLFLTPG